MKRVHICIPRDLSYKIRIKYQKSRKSRNLPYKKDTFKRLKMTAYLNEYSYFGVIIEGNCVYY